MARVGRLLGAALGLLLAVTPRESRADDDSERAESSFHEGNRAFAAGDYHAAFDAYRAAWSLKQSFDIACNLGRTEVELSLSRDAAEHLDYCLRTFSVSSREEVRDANKRFRELFQRVRREVGALTVDVRPSGAELTVDGASYGAVPLGHEIFLTPGTHVVRAHLSGFQAEERSITADAGGSLNVTLTLTAAPALAAVPVAAGTAGPPPAATSPGLEPRTIVMISGAAASLVALGVGVGFSLAANAARDDASRYGAAASAAGDVCVDGASAPTCVSYRDAADRQEENRHRADIALITGAALGGATLVSWFLIPDITRSKVGSVRALPWFGAGVSGLSFAGRY